MGIPLLNYDCVTWQIWDEQKRHLPCIQDPEGVQLYMETGKRKKGGIELPIYRFGLAKNDKVKKFKEYLK
jgi:hypothetical protein